MTLTDLRYIVVLARERHFGRAAERCFVAQPTLSVAVKKLEDELGVMIFERGQGEVRVTPVGERIVAQAEKVLNEAAQVKEMAQAGKDPLSGPLRLGAIYTIGPYLLPRLIPLMHERAPNMPLFIEENYTHRLAEKLRAGEVDVIVIALPFGEPGIVTQALYDEPFRVVMPVGHPWSGRESIPPQDLEDEKLLLLGAGNCFRDQVLEACPRHSPDGTLQRTLEGSSLETIRQMVASGIAITVLPCTATDDSAHNPLLAIRSFSEPEPSRRVALAWRASFPRPQAMDVLRRAILACRLPGVTPV
ncbi:MAG: LysR substrate-binding domain-containing protein [Rhodocyclaceae bacterium]|nr:LysR substrate-binding domain-containing protein [Rhodocyclaceae bacterium]